MLSLSVGLALINPDCRNAQDTEKYMADIEIQKTDKGMNFQGLFINNGAESVNFVYRLTIHKRGRSGRSSSSQGGFSSADPGGKKTLSLVNMNLQDGDAYTATLQIYSGQEVIAEKTVSSLVDL